MSIRLRLTLLYSLILALALIIFSAALYFTVSRVTLAVIEETLADEAQRLITSRDFKLDRIGYSAKRFVDPQTYVQTLHLNGHIADRTANLGSYVLPLSDTGWKTCQKGEAWTEIASTADGRLLVYNQPVRIYDQVTGVLQVARSLVEYDQSLNTLRSILISGSLIATLTTFGLGWVLAGAALRPIDRITQTARTIGAERDFGRRVNHVGPDDEVGRLTATLNTMLTELQSAYQQLEHTLRAQHRFVADASHELRTPLTTLRGNLGLLEREPPISVADRRAVLTDSVEECDRLIRLVHNLLVLARADSGLALRKEPLALQPFVDELCRQTQLLAHGRPIHCQNTFDTMLFADRDALKQVLLILLDNAIQYTPPTGTIAIKTALAGKDVAIQVHDTGPGIPASALPHIFERFYRVEAARSGTGTGLGLAIAKELIEAQGGTITVESRVGRGSTFTVSVPGGVHPESRR